MSGRYWDGCRAAPVRLIGWTCAKKAFGLAFAAHIPDERLAALAHVHVLNACAVHAPARRERPRGSRRATKQRDELASFQLIESHPIPASQGRIAGYRIGEDHQRASE
jgi:hypothetical protein